MESFDLALCSRRSLRMTTLVSWNAFRDDGCIESRFLMVFNVCLLLFGYIIVIRSWYVNHFQTSDPLTILQLAIAQDQSKKKIKRLR
jgi:hypothetical protein